ncbi:hypothetical protein AGMMS50229_13810 [Campylobacterota bacterium]|nr:hypothetical protein AGMMS50229_13810 [Campylobacterota bacterium]
MSSFNDTEATRKAAPSITRLVISSGDVIDSILVTVNGTTDLPKHGGNGGGAHEIILAPGEFIKGIEGQKGEYFGANHLVTLKIITNHKTYGTFGSGAHATSKTPFSKSARTEVVAFSGETAKHTDGTEFISSLDIVEK